MPYKRIQELWAQFFRAENPEVIQAVAEELHDEINQYVQNASNYDPPVTPTHRAA